MFRFPSVRLCRRAESVQAANTVYVTFVRCRSLHLFPQTLCSCRLGRENVQPNFDLLTINSVVFKKNVFLSSGIWWGRNLQRFAFLLPTEHYRCRFSDFCKTAVCDGLFFPSLAGFDNAGFSLFLNFFVWDRKFFNRSVFAGGKKQVLSRFFNRFSSLIGYLRIFTDIFVIMKRRQIRSLAAKYPAICSFGRPAAKCGLPKAIAGHDTETADSYTQKTLTQEWKKTRDQRS